MLHGTTSVTGRCLLARGELVTDFADLTDFLPPEIDELLAIKRRRNPGVDRAHATAWHARLAGVLGMSVVVSKWEFFQRRALQETLPKARLLKS